PRWSRPRRCACTGSTGMGIGGSRGWTGARCPSPGRGRPPEAARAHPNPDPNPDGPDTYPEVPLSAGSEGDFVVSVVEAARTFVAEGLGGGATATATAAVAAAATAATEAASRFAAAAEEDNL